MMKVIIIIENFYNLFVNYLNLYMLYRVISMSDITHCIFNDSFYDNKTILITGGTGTIGNAITEYILNNTQIKKICIFSRDEFKQHSMRLKFNNNNKLRFLIGDIKDKERVAFAMNNIDIVIHAAALKQVDSIEYNPYEAIKTNIIGTQNVIDACIYKNVKQLIGISTDKCVEPCNLYGATKLCLEKLILSANFLSQNKTKACVLRYGNVVSSRGSVIPIFLNQKGKEFTVTHPDMTRFTLTQNQAMFFILNCISISNGGEIFVPKLQKYSIKQLCKVICPVTPIKVIGMRPGEKMHESMFCEAESLNIWEANDFFIISTTELNTDNYNVTLQKNTTMCNYSSRDAEYIDEGSLMNVLIQ